VTILLVITRSLTLAIFLVTSGLILYCVMRARRGHRLPELKRIAGIEAIDEAINRATEMGKPVHYSPGTPSVQQEDAAETLASMSILTYVAQKCAQRDLTPIVTIPGELVYPLALEATRAGYVAAGRVDSFQEDHMVRFVPGQNPHTAYCLGLFERERPAANFLIGSWMATAMTVAEAAAQAGAVQVGGTMRIVNLPFLVVSCDYTLITEEVVAAGAYLSRDPTLVGALEGQDYVKYALMVFIAAGVVARTFGSDAIMKLINQYAK
jgi:hypothetical protein